MNRFYCFNCGKRLKYAQEHTSKKLKCPNCDHPLALPNALPTGSPATDDQSHQPHPDREAVPKQEATLPFNSVVVVWLAAGTVPALVIVSLTIWLIFQRSDRARDTETASLKDTVFSWPNPGLNRRGWFC